MYIREFRRRNSILTLNFAAGAYPEFRVVTDRLRVWALGAAVHVAPDNRLDIYSTLIKVGPDIAIDSDIPA